MEHCTPMHRTKIMLATLLSAFALSACGLKGPLYLPGEEPPSRPDSEQPADQDDLDGGAAAT